MDKNHNKKLIRVMGSFIKHCLDISKYFSFYLETRPPRVPMSRVG